MKRPWFKDWCEALAAVALGFAAGMLVIVGALYWLHP